MRISLLVLLNESYLKKCSKFHALHRCCHSQIIPIPLESILDDQKLVESSIKLKFTCCLVPAVMLETTQQAYLLTVFLGLPRVS